MKTLRFVSAVLVACCLTAGIFAADPSGSWQWSVTPTNADPVEVTLKLALKEGKLTGVYNSPFGEAPISNASFKDGAIAFAVEREINGNKFTIKYAGKLEGDAIKGTVVLPNFGGDEQPVTMVWNAKRVK